MNSQKTHLLLLTMDITITCFFILLVRVNSATRPLFACDPANPSTKDYEFCNPKLPINVRAKNLVTQLNLDEKIAQLTNSAPPIPRLGVPAYEWWGESLHGVSRHGRGFRFNGTFDGNGTIFNGTATIKAATMFPQIILIAASFDSQLWYRIARAIGTEARAMYNVGQGKGLTLWAPNINIFRDPRWGRGQETPGEDPLLTSIYGTSYVRGIQGFNFVGKQVFDHLQASACCKHFTAHDLDNWQGTTRYKFDAKVNKQDMADTFEPPFKSCVEEGRASSIMCAYNRVNGVPMCASTDLLTETARKQWRFDGYITSDCNAVPIIHDEQGYAKTPEDAVAAVLKAGMDVECGTYTRQYAKSALEQKKVTQVEIDQALTNLFSVRMRLGLFDGNPIDANPFGKLGPSQVCDSRHKILARDAARKGIVLLKNSGNLLPLSKTETKSLAVIGPNADDPQVLLGNYEGIPCKSVTPLQALKRYVKHVKHHPGCNAVQCSSASVEVVVEIAKMVDRVVLVMGLDQTMEREKLDREDLVLPGKQQSLITRIANVAKKPVVLVLLSGGPVDISQEKDNEKVGGILWAGYPGQDGGTAIAEVIFGDYNPGGRLPMTWYPQDFVKVPMTDMRMRADKSSGYPGRTYRFYQGKKVFEFGYGLSYSNYTYEFDDVSQEKLSLSKKPQPRKGRHHHCTRLLKSMNEPEPVLVSELGREFCNAKETKFKVVVRVKNHGKEGKHAVLLFVRPEEQNDEDPIKQLVGFHNVHLFEGEEGHIKFEVNPCEHITKANKDGLMVIEPGSYFLVVGDAEHKIEITP